MRSVGALLFAVVPGMLLATATPSSALSQAVVAETEDMIRRADVVVVGTVTDVRSEWSADRTRILSRVTINVDEHIKGDASEQSVVLTVPGGEVDGVGELYSHSASFKTSEQVVVFAARDRKGQLRVVDGDAGKANVRKEERTGRRFLSDNEPLETYTARLRHIVQSQATHR